MSTLASIGVGPVSMPADDLRGRYITTDGVEVDYMIHNRYETDNHRYMIGVSTPGGFNGATVAFVQMASPTLLLVSDWTVAKLRGKPDIPDPTLNDPNWVLLDATTEPAMVTVAADGVTPLYRISGTYYYGHKNLLQATQTFPRPSWLDTTNVDRTVTPDMLTKNTIDTPTATGGITEIGKSIEPVFEQITQTK